MELKHKNALIQQLAEQLQHHARHQVSHMEVTIKHDESDVGFTFGFTTFVDYLANNTYWDERGNWSDASLLDLHTI